MTTRQTIFTTCLLMAVSGNAFAQTKAFVSKLPTKETNQLESSGLQMRSTPSSGSDSDRGLKNKKIWQNNFNREDNLSSKKVERKYLAGGQDGNGGDTALDKKTNHRKLLDLIENDELNYFIPNPLLYNQVIPLELTRLLQIMRAECNAFLGRPFICPQQSDGSNENLLKLADYIFIDVMIRSYGFSSLLTDGTGNSIYLQDYSGLVDFEKQFGLAPVTPLKWVFVDFDLDEINDEGTVQIDYPETKKQLAVQKDGVVLINRSEFNSLDDVSKAGLFIHESVLRAVIVLNPSLLASQGTEPIRTFTRRLIKYFLSRRSTQAYPSFAVREAYDLLGIKKTK